MNEYENDFLRMLDEENEKESELDRFTPYHDNKIFITPSRTKRKKYTEEELIKMDIDNKIKFFKVDISKAINITKYETLEEISDQFFSVEFWINRIEEIEQISDIKDLTITSKSINLIEFVIDKFYNGKHIADVSSMPISEVFEAFKIKNYIME